LKRRVIPELRALSVRKREDPRRRGRLRQFAERDGARLPV